MEQFLPCLQLSPGHATAVDSSHLVNYVTSFDVIELGELPRKIRGVSIDVVNSVGIRTFKNLSGWMKMREREKHEYNIYSSPELPQEKSLPRTQQTAHTHDGNDGR